MPYVPTRTFLGTGLCASMVQGWGGASTKRAQGISTPVSSRPNGFTGCSEGVPKSELSGVHLETNPSGSTICGPVPAFQTSDDAARLLASGKELAARV